MTGTAPGVVTTRPMRVDDVAAVHALGDRYMAQVQGRRLAVSVEGLTAQLALPGRDLETDVPVVTIDGRILAFGSAWVGPPHREIVMSVLIEVGLAEPAASAVRQALVDAVLRSAQRRDLTIGPDPLRHASLAVQAQDALLASVAARNGFVLERQSWLMAIDQSVDKVAPAVWPEGIEVRAVAVDDGPVLAELSRDAFADHPGDNEYDDEGMAAYLLEPSTRRDLSLLASDDLGPVGMILCDQQTDGGYVNMLGVRARARGRGLATALLRHAFRGFAAEGLDVVRLHVEEANPTGAVGLYESVGMRRASAIQAWTRAPSS